MSDMSSTILENLLQKYNVSPSFLNQQCDDVLLFSLALQIHSFKATAACFGSTQSKIQEIQQNFPPKKSMKIQMLWDWKRRQRNNATYFAIFEVLQNMKDDQNMCHFVIQHVKKLSLKQHDHPIISHIHPNKFYLYWEELSKLERDELTCAIYDENEDIRSIFASLFSDILNSFEARHVDVKELKHFLISLGTPVALQHSESSASCFNYLRNATNLAEMFMELLWNHLSWFNISLLKRLVSKYGSQNDQQMTKEYEENNLCPYLERAICFIPSDSYVSCCDTTNLIFLRIKLPSKTKPKGQDSYVLKQNLSQHLCIDDGILRMVRYEAESNDVVFTLSEVTRRFSVKPYIIWESAKSYRLKLTNEQLQDKVFSISPHIESNQEIQKICDDYFLFTFALKFEKSAEVITALKATLPADNNSTSLEATNPAMDYVKKLQFMWRWRKMKGDRATYMELKDCFRRNQQLIAFIRKYGNSLANFSAQQNAAVREEFAILSAQIFCSFQKQNILLTDLLLFLQQCAVREDADPLKDNMFPTLDTLADAFSEIYKHTSWINHQLLKRIVNKMGNENDKLLIERFQKNFILPHILNLSLSKQSCFNFNMYTSDTYINFNVSPTNIMPPVGPKLLRITENIASLLGLPDKSFLQLVSYDHKSNELVYGIHKALYDQAVFCFDDTGNTCKLKETQEIWYFPTIVRGYCIVIDNICPVATTAYTNKEKVKSFFGDTFGYHVQYYHHLTVNAMREVLLTVRDCDQSHCSSLAIIILCQGEGGNCFATDYNSKMRNSISVEEITSYYSDESCPQLFGKAKIFLFDIWSPEVTTQNSPMLTTEEDRTNLLPTSLDNERIIDHNMNTYSHTYKIVCNISTSVLMRRDGESHLVNQLQQNANTVKSLQQVLTETSQQLNLNEQLIIDATYGEDICPIKELSAIEEGLKIIVEFNMVTAVWCPIRENVMAYLTQKKAEILKTARNCHIAKISGASAGIVGGVLTIVGFGLLPVTFGGSIALSAIGTVIAVAGGTTSGGTAIAERFIVKGDLKKVQETIVLDKQITVNVNELLQEIEKLNNDTAKIRNKFSAEDTALLFLRAGKAMIQFGTVGAKGTITGLEIAELGGIAAVESFGFGLRLGGAAVTGVAVVGGVVSALLLPLDVYEIIANSIRLSKKKGTNASKSIDNQIQIMAQQLQIIQYMLCGQAVAQTEQVETETEVIENEASLETEGQDESLIVEST